MIFELGKRLIFPDDEPSPNAVCGLDHAASFLPHELKLTRQVDVQLPEESIQKRQSRRPQRKQF